MRSPNHLNTLAAGVLVAAGLALASCGGSQDAPTILDTEKVERAIEDSSFAQRGENAQASCPSGVHQKDGLSFECTAVTEAGSTRFIVTQEDGSGNVHFEAP